MKSRKKLPSANSKLATKRSDTTLDRSGSAQLHQQRKRVVHSSTSLQRLDFIQNHSKLFPKNGFNCAGDAESYFKQSLRNYEYFDFRLFQPAFKNRASTHSARTSEASSRKSKKSKSSTKTTTTKPQKKVKPSPSQTVKVPEDLDFDIFYSPSSRTYKSSSKGSTSTLKNQETDITSGDFKMAEGEEEIPVAIAEEGAAEAEAEAEEETPIEVIPIPEDGEEEGEGGEDEMQEVERMIQEASEELEQAAEENEQLITDIEEGEEAGEEEGEEAKAGGDGSLFKFDPAVDAAVLRELEDAERQAKETAKIIFELKTRVTELLKKEQTTEAEAKELEQKNCELRKQMMLFEEKTKRIQCLIAQTNLFENMVQPKPTLQVKHKEDCLPKVIVCGVTENNMPKLILCDDKKGRSSCDERKRRTSSCFGESRNQAKDVNVPVSVVPQFAKRLSDSYCMQERLAAENADLEGMRYKLQSDLLCKDQTIEYLQQKLCSIQYEMRMLCKENNDLNDRMQQMCTSPAKSDSSRCKKPTCGKAKGTCPAEIENRLNDYSETTKMLEKQLAEMENEVKNMQNELCAVQAERDHLEQHRKILICPTPICVPTPCPPPPCPPSPCSSYSAPPTQQMGPCCAAQPPQMPCPMPPQQMMMPCGPSPEQQLRELREQYCQLQDDFKSKVTEVGALRTDNEKLKQVAKDADELRKSMDDKIKEYERTIRMMKLETNKFAGSKEQIIEQESQLAVAKQRFRDAQDELEELRALIEDQKGQLDDYRNKYLEAQQLVEEQKRKLDMNELDANRLNEQVNLEIQRVKNQFQEKLQELLPLPDMLKTTQLKLSEAQQMHMLAERNNEALNKELQVYKDKVAEITARLEQYESDQRSGEDGKMSMASQIKSLEEKLEELIKENDELNYALKEMEKIAEANETKAQEKMHEIVQLNAQLESVREESARQVARNKERCETVRRSMQNQISDLERQLAQSRAQARSAQKDRDEIRQKMQAQINNLHENFEDAQMRIRNLQGHVNFLKDSHNNAALPGYGDPESAAHDKDACFCG